MCVFLLSIDPPSCEDIDDALSCERMENGNYEIGVHIADVGYYVEKDTPIDLEARKRGTLDSVSNRTPETCLLRL